MSKKTVKELTRYRSTLNPEGPLENSDMKKINEELANLETEMKKQTDIYTKKFEEQNTKTQEGLALLEEQKKNHEQLKDKFDKNEKELVTLRKQLIDKQKNLEKLEENKTKIKEYETTQNEAIEIARKISKNLKENAEIYKTISEITNQIKNMIEPKPSAMANVVAQAIKVTKVSKKRDKKKGKRLRGGGRKLNRWRYISHHELFGGYSKDTLIKKARKWGISNPTKYKTRQELQTVMKVLMHCKYGDVGKRSYLNLIAKNININPKNYKKKHNLYNAICNKTKNISFNLRGGRKKKQ